MKKLMMVVALFIAAEGAVHAQIQNQTQFPQQDRQSRTYDSTHVKRTDRTENKRYAPDTSNKRNNTNSYHYRRTDSVTRRTTTAPSKR